MSLLTVTGLRIEVLVKDLGWREAVSGIDFALDRGEALGLVGESGCGKSLTVLSLLGLLPHGSVAKTGGEITFDGQVLGPDPRSWRGVRGARIGFVPQDPMTGLNPVFSVGEQVAEAVRLHEELSRSGARDRACELLGQVGIPAPLERYDAYPHQLSGGQRQRVLIAIALAGDPELLIADEPTTALDVTVQAQVLRLLTRLRQDRALALLFITHDLAVVAQTCEQLAILYAGQVVESGPCQTVLRSPAHPYTRGLLASMPGVGGPRKGRLSTIQGVVPGVGRWPTGCRFRDRCPRAAPICITQAPAPARLDPAGLDKDRVSACHFAAEALDG